MNKNFFLLVVIFVFLGIPLAGAVAQRVQQSPKMMRLSQSAGSSIGITQDMGRGEDASVVSVSPGMPVANEKMMVDSYMVPPMPGGGFVATTDRSIIKTANLGLQVESPAEAVQKITAIAKEKKGLVTNSNIYDYEGDDGGIQADIVLRVPTDSLEDTLTAIKNVATRVVTESVNAQDQTEQRVDIEAQLKNLRATEQQFTSILTKAQTVADTLQVQQQLSQTRSQIERLEAQLQNLQGSVQMASISVSLSTKADSLPLVDGSELSIMEELKLALRSSFRLYRGLFIAGVTLLIVASPLLLAGALAYGVYWKVMKKRK